MARSRLPRTFLALTLSAAQVSVCALRRRGRTHQLIAAGRFRHPEGMGDLRQFLVDHKLTRAPAHVIVAGEDVLYEAIPLEKKKGVSPDQQIRDELSARAGGPVPLMAWIQSDASSGSGQAASTVLAAGLKPAALARALPLAHQLGLRLRGITPLPMTLLALARGEAGDEPTDRIVVYLGPDRARLLAGRGLEPVYTKKLRREPPESLKHPEEAWRFPRTRRARAADDPALFAALTDSDPSPLIEEIARVVASLESQGRVEPRSLLLAGDLVRTPQVDANLESRLGLTVERASGTSLCGAVPDKSIRKNTPRPEKTDPGRSRPSENVADPSVRQAAEAPTDINLGAAVINLGGDRTISENLIRNDVRPPGDINLGGAETTGPVPDALVRQSARPPGDINLGGGETLSGACPEHAISSDVTSKILSAAIQSGRDVDSARDPDATPGWTDLYAPALGLLALCRRGQALLLRPRRKRQPGAVLRTLVRPLAAAAAAAILTWGVLHHATLLAASKAHHQALTSLAPLPSPKARPDPDAPARAYLTGSPLPRALAALSADVPPNLMLTTLELVRGPDGAWLLGLEGLAENRDGLTAVAAFGRFLTRLDSEPWIERVDVKPWTIDQGAKSKDANKTDGTLRFRCRAPIRGLARSTRSQSGDPNAPAGGGGGSGIPDSPGLAPFDASHGSSPQSAPDAPLSDDWFGEER